MNQLNLRPNKVFVMEYEVYRYVGQHRMTLDEMLQGVANAYDRLVKEGYIAREEISDDVLRGKCTLKGEEI
jgi:hypothetical protein